MTGEFSVAVHGLVYLLHKGETVSSRELADNICTNPARVRKVMAELGRAGLVQAREGRSASGYHRIPGGGEITLLQVLDAVEDTAVPSAWRTGDMDRACLISSGMGDLMDGICRELNELCRERLNAITIGQINHTIFDPEGGVAQ